MFCRHSEFINHIKRVLMPVGLCVCVRECPYVNANLKHTKFNFSNKLKLEHVVAYKKSSE